IRVVSGIDIFFFFFQAEDGIRDRNVTGVQTCALPIFQSKASNTSGITFVRREPKMKPEIGTPCGSSQFGATEGHWCTGTVKREFGCAASVPGLHGRPCQSTRPAGGWGVSPSHHGSPEGVSATLVKIVLLLTMAVALGFVFGLVLGATPKNPFAGWLARRWPG